MRNREQRTLFGKRRVERRPRYEAAIERQDRRQIPARAARVRWLKEVVPRNVGYILPVETAFVFEEARSCFVYGHFVATIVLAAAFLEHWLISNLNSRGFEKEASRGLAAAIKFARKNKFADPIVLDKAEHLRLIRNPFVHLKESDHEHNLTRRTVKSGTDPWVQSEIDARESIMAMYAVATYWYG